MAFVQCMHHILENSLPTLQDVIPELRRLSVTGHFIILLDWLPWVMLYVVRPWIHYFMMLFICYKTVL